MMNWFLLCFLFLPLIKYIWNRRWLYYYSSKLEGPFALPIIGSAYLCFGGQKEFSKKLLKIIDSYSPVFKMWLGQDLITFVSEPRDLEIILYNSLEKGNIFEFGKGITRDGLLMSSVPKWKKNRKIINPTFSSTILNSLTDIFNRHSKQLVKTLEKNLDDESFDIFWKVFRCTLDMAIETSTDADAELVRGQENFIKNVLRMEAFVAIRTCKVWLYPNFLFKCSSMGKEFAQMEEENYDFIKQIVDIQKPKMANEENESSVRKNFFLKHLFNVHQTQKLLTEEEIHDETLTMLMAASETTALTISMVLLVLSIRPDIQEMVKKELDSIFETDNRDVTLDDIKKMIYLDCVIKETLRLLPTAPIIIRIAEQNIELDAYTIPAGSFIVVPIVRIHRRPDLWKNPMEFNPDRFLNQEVEKHNRCMFLPFSYGPRSCIGMKYGMMSMKILLSTLLRHYTFQSAQYKCLDDIVLMFNVLAKPADGYNVKINTTNI